MKKSPLSINSIFDVKPASVLCLLAGLLANKATAQNQYFTTVANGGSYSWDAANWNASPASGNTGPYTSSWTPGDFARFYNGAGDNFTVTVNASESMAGLYLNAGSSATVNINDAGNNTGSLSIVAGTSQATQNGFSWLTQAFLTGGGNVVINAPITGSGGVEEESGGGSLQLLGNNSYTGGTLFTSSSTFVDYNNNNSFGATSSQIGFDGTTFSIMDNTGSSSVNIANAVQIIGTTGVNFIGNSATMSGNWTLGANTANIRNNGVGTTETLSGVISGTGPLTFSGANHGIIKLSGANTFSGATTIGVSGDTAVTVMLGAANALASSSKITLAGGALNAGGFSQANTGTLGLSASSSLYFGGTASLSFADSSGLTWTGTLDLADWIAGTTSLEFGSTSTALTSAQLADIEFNNNAATLGSAYLNAEGYVVPEPSSVSLGVLGGLGGLAMFWKVRSRKS